MSPETMLRTDPVDEARIGPSGPEESAAIFRACCGDAVGEVAAMADRVRALARQFRQSDVRSGHAGLARLAGDLRTLVTLLQSMTALPGVDPAWLTVDGASAQQQIARLGGWLGLLVSAQGEADWLTVADILEYDLEPALRGWAQKLGDGAA